MSTEEREAINAAAPDLLEALKWMVDNDETNESDTEGSAYYIDGLNQARAAINKATKP